MSMSIAGGRLVYDFTVPGSGLRRGVHPLCRLCRARVEGRVAIGMLRVGVRFAVCEACLCMVWGGLHTCPFTVYHFQRKRPNFSLSSGVTGGRAPAVVDIPVDILVDGAA